LKQESTRLKDLRDYLIKNVLERIPRAFLNGHPKNRLPNNVHFRFDYIEGESLLLAMKDEGISISTGSACTSKTLEPSHTLIATGLLHEEAHGSLEVTLGRYSTKDDVDKFLDVLPRVVTRLRDLSPLTR
jgi:cysteine desulfurase